MDVSIVRGQTHLNTHRDRRITIDMLNLFSPMVSQRRNSSAVAVY
jgi:hypothetical protein